MCRKWLQPVVGWLTLHEKPINIMHKNAIKRTHAPNGRIQCNSQLFEMLSFFHFRCFILCLGILPYFTRLDIARSKYIHTLNKHWMNCIQRPCKRIRSINAKWMRLHNLCCGKQSPTKLTAVIFAAPRSVSRSKFQHFVSSSTSSHCFSDVCTLYTNTPETGTKTMHEEMYGQTNKREKDWKRQMGAKEKWDNDNEEKMERKSVLKIVPVFFWTVIRNEGGVFRALLCAAVFFSLRSCTRCI